MTETANARGSPFLEARHGRLVRLATDLVKYGFASAAALALDTGLLLFLNKTAGLHYLIAAPIGFSAGLVLVYLLSIRYVFRGRRGARPTREFLGFLATGVAGLLLNELLMQLFVENLGLSVALAKMPTAGFVFVFNFTARRALLFSAPSSPAKNPSCAP